jgi:hypothetical protein
MKAMSLFVLTLLFLSSSIFSQSATVESITKSPGSYQGDNVTVKGLVTIYRTGSGNTRYYLLRGDYGAVIKVNTAEGSPEINKMYTVEGIVYVDVITGVPFISEKTRVIETTSPPPPPPTFWEKLLSFLKDNVIILILIGVLVVLVAAYFLLRGKKSTEPVSAYTPPSYTPSASDYSAPTVKLSPNDMQQQSNDDFKTIKISTSSPKTLKFIPGKLTIVSGEDTGKSFKIAGYPTSEGSIVSIGREEVKGERAYSHIQLMQKTISRKQAEIVQKDSKLYVKNLSDTNYTQLDSVELKINEKAELKAGAVLRLGELEVKYEV